MYEILIIWISKFQEWFLINIFPVPYLGQFKKISATNKDWGSFMIDKVWNINLPDYNARKICNVATQWNRINEIVKKYLQKAPSDRLSTDECRQTVRKKYQRRHITWIFIKERRCETHKKTLLKVIYEIFIFINQHLK